MSQPASPAEHVRAALGGAFALARGRREGMDAMPAGPQASARSFWAMALCLPAFFALRLLAWNIVGTPADPLHDMAAAALLFVIGWTGYAVLSHRVVAILGRAAFWPRYIVAWNWCNVAQYVLFLLAGLLGMLDLPDWLDQTLSLIALFWALWLEWYVARLALQVGALPAMLMVALDVTIGLLLAV